MKSNNNAGPVIVGILVAALAVTGGLILAMPAKPPSKKDDELPDSSITQNEEPKKQLEKIISDSEANTSASQQQFPQWTKSSIALSGLPDPYNPDSARLAAARNQQAAMNSEVGQAYRTTRTILGMVPVAGQIITVLANFFDVIGAEIKSSGGYEALSPLSRKRLLLYGLIGSAKNPWPSQAYDQQAQRPETSIEYAEYAKKYAAWLRRYLIENAKKAEQYRIINTTDDASLPPLVIDLLMAENEWPPPLEPMPLTREEWIARRPDVAAGYPEMDYRLIDRFDPLTRAVYAELRSQYEADAARFAARIRAILQPEEVRQLAAAAGSIPRLGSAAAPIVRLAPARRIDRF